MQRTALYLMMLAAVVLAGCSEGTAPPQVTSSPTASEGSANVDRSGAPAVSGRAATGQPSSGNTDRMGNSN